MYIASWFKANKTVWTSLKYEFNNFYVKLMKRFVCALLTIELSSENPFDCLK